MGNNGYVRIPVELQSLEMYGNFVLVVEDLDEKVSAGGLVTNVGQKVTTVGNVLKVGSGVTDDLQKGDTVIYEAWMGGRWSIDDTKCLIMDVANILMVVEREED
ncbi:hypothetical protein LCGC14_1973160 [marine sediment metagenome]|uniref:10 kDa chaperonin n=1 Tax=marine sediment metagenome TaxID=412755 RepID=A0A0F9FBJ8_9ZZZZ